MADNRISTKLIAFITISALVIAIVAYLGSQTIGYQALRQQYAMEAEGKSELSRVVDMIESVLQTEEEKLRQGDESAVQQAFILDGNQLIYPDITESLSMKEQTFVQKIATQNVPVEKEYRFDQNYGFTTGDGQNLKAAVSYRLNNTKENQLGMPLPKGIFRMYKNDTSGNALLVGEDRINHIAENEEFIIKTGDAFDVSMTKTLTNQQAIAKDVKQYTYDVVFNNAKDEAVEVNYSSVVDKGYTWQILKTTQPTIDSQHSGVAQWKVKIPAKEKVTLTYTLQVSLNLKN